jgi:Holliday junction resolvase RusA-like endonuclease
MCGEIMNISFFVPGLPIAQPRQRHAMIAGHVRNYTPASHPVNAFKATVRMAAREAYKGKPLDGPLDMTLVFLFPRTKAMQWKTKPMPRMLYTKKPDLDNAQKSFADALNDWLYVDDSQIVTATITKLYAAGDEQPGVYVVIETMDKELSP